jgi:hypothetical protein
MQSILITGGARIGQTLLQAWRPDDRGIDVDALTYATPSRYLKGLTADLWRDVINSACKAWIDKIYSFRIAV